MSHYLTGNSILKRHTYTVVHVDCLLLFDHQMRMNHLPFISNAITHLQYIYHIKILYREINVLLSLSSGIYIQKKQLNGTLCYDEFFPNIEFVKGKSLKTTH